MTKKAKAGKGGTGAAKAFPVVGVGASAGGFEAAQELLKALPPAPGMALVIVQHLDPSHKSALVALLQKSTSLKVVEVKDGMPVEADHVYVIPPNASMIVENRRLKLAPRGVERHPMPIDRFLASLAEDLKSRAIGVILSGLASDGVNGLEAVKAEGGITFAQDEKSAKYPEMPRNAAAAGCVDFVLAPQGIARELARVLNHPYVAQAADARLLDQDVAENPKEFARIFALLRKATQVDFSHYKRATIKRRIARRLALHKMQTLDEYADYLQKTPKEVEALFHDILIKVTGFFRDAGAFAQLKAKIFPALLKSRGRNAPLRIWVPGCATGEEAYSIAMSLVEYCGTQHLTIPCQIFATDLSETAIERARAGVYMEHIASGVSPERLRRFFVKVDGGWQIAKMIRDMCVIAKQDLVKDPPFSKLDLISCRNLLIYLEPLLHRKVFPLFHYALRPGGYLMLGGSETVGSFSNLFSLVDRKHKIYARRQVAVPVHFDMPVADLAVDPAAETKKVLLPPAKDVDVQREVDRLILNKYTPAGVVVNDDLEILQFRGRTDRYLLPAPGKASLNLLKMAREGLLFELRTLLQRCKKEGLAVRSAPLKMTGPDQTWYVRIDVIPLSSATPQERQFLVLFEEAPDGTAKAAGRKSAARVSDAERMLDQMRQELTATKEHLQAIIEEQETTNEELKSANEEILSSNEELQSTNEELETAKEELQSTNEELTTLNEELQTRNLELIQVNNDISNLLACVNVPVIMLGNDLRIRRFTPMSEKILNLIPTDVGRPITDIKPNIEVPDLEALVQESIETVATLEREVRDRQGRWHSVRIRPYKTRDNKIDGAVLIFVDIDEHKRSLDDFAKARDFSDGLLELVGEGVAVLDADLKIRRVNRAFQETFQLSAAEVEGKAFVDLEGGLWNLPDLRSQLQRVASTGEVVRDVKVKLDVPRLSPPSSRTYRVNARRVSIDGASDARILVLVADQSRAKP